MKSVKKISKFSVKLPSPKNFDLDSFAVYGSVARGVASNMSDIDILLVPTPSAVA